jgi:BlaI family penicillinase repressor
MSPEKRLRSLSPAEWQIMNLCWRLGRSTAREIYEASLERQERGYQTVKTLLDRIAAKGYLTVEKLGPLCVYEPRRRRRETVAAAIDDFVETVLDHVPRPLMTYLAASDDLDEDERRRLREILTSHGTDEDPSDG